MKEQTKIDGGHAEIVPLECYHTGTGKGSRAKLINLNAKINLSSAKINSLDTGSAVLGQIRVY
jgi:hypothetical protein